MNKLKITVAHERIRLAYEALQDRGPDEKLYVAYSGGKDSECVVDLCIDAVGGEAIEINYNATGIDPPESVKHIKERFTAWSAEGIECHFNKPRANMHDLIVKKGPPTRMRRYCCEKLKEGASKGRVTITGVRWGESAFRAANHGVVTIPNKNKKRRAVYNDDNDISRRIVEHCATYSRITINPIVDWTHNDVWDYIREKTVVYCKLYDEGFERIGCIGCPMARDKRYKQFVRWPHMRRFYMRAFADMLAVKPEWYIENYEWHTADDVWHWWMEDGHVHGQMEMFEEIENI